MNYNVTARYPFVLIVLMAVQLACAVFFVNDATADYLEDGAGSMDLHLVVESLATLSLLVAIILEGRLLAGLLRQKARLEDQLISASSEVHAVILAEFEAWRLSPAERDIAMFIVKGLGTQDIAEMRGSAEGTIKAHLNSIFRKAGAHSRVEMLSILIDRLLGNRLGEEASQEGFRKEA